MNPGLTTPLLKQAILLIQEKIESCADELNQLDGVLGDGDLGITLQRGFRGIKDEVSNLPDDVGKAFLICAQALIKVSGSTFGTLFATGLLSAANSIKDEVVVKWERIPFILDRAIKDMQQRGRSELGDKTILDAIDATRTAICDLDDPDQMLKAADAAQDKALTEFKTRISKQGRARIFRENSIGLDDPGMVAFKRMTEALFE